MTQLAGNDSSADLGDQRAIDAHCVDRNEWTLVLAGLIRGPSLLECISHHLYSDSVGASDS